MFKQALIRIAQAFEKQVKEGKISADLSLSRKLDRYQRTSMIGGIDPKSKTHRDTKKMLESLLEICKKNEPDFSNKFISYEKFQENTNQLRVDEDRENSDSELKTTTNLRFIDYAPDSTASLDINTNQIP